MTPVPLCRPQASQEGPPGDALRSPLLCPQPQALGQSILQAEMDCELHSSLQVCGPLPWAASGAGLVSFPVVGTTRAPAPPGPQVTGSCPPPAALAPPRGRRPRRSAAASLGLPQRPVGHDRQRGGQAGPGGGAGGAEAPARWLGPEAHAGRGLRLLPVHTSV